MTLVVENLVSGYGSVPVLHGVTFRQESGEILGVVGQNGMGKTTLLKTLMGLLKTQGRSICFEGAEVAQLPAHARSRIGFGYIPQGGSSFPGLTVLETLRLAAAVGTQGRARSIDEILDIFPELARYLNRSSSALSGGERQMLAIARALIRSPRLLLLDELSEGVQPSIVEKLAERLLQLHATEKISILLVDQELAFVASMATRAVILHKGRISAEVSADRLFDLDLFGLLKAVQS